MTNRCLSCNKVLSRQERIRKYASTGGEIGLCNHCFSYIEDQLKEAEKVYRKDEVHGTFLGTSTV